MKKLATWLRRQKILAEIRQLYYFIAATDYQWASPSFRIRLPQFFVHNPELHYERVEIELLLKIHSRFDYVVDVGANIGLYTGLFAALGKTVLALEPSWFNRLYLKRMIRMNSFEDRVRALALAAGDSSGTVKIYGEQTGASLLPGFHNIPAQRAYDVRMNTLDAIIRDEDLMRGQKLLLKVDVEGFEDKVLDGARAVLVLQPNPVWFIEVAERNWTKVTRLFAQTGYKSAVRFSTHGYDVVNASCLPSAFPNNNAGLKYANLIFFDTDPGLT